MNFTIIKEGKQKKNGENDNSALLCNGGRRVHASFTDSLQRSRRASINSKMLFVSLQLKDPLPSHKYILR